MTEANDLAALRAELNAFRGEFADFKSKFGSLFDGLPQLILFFNHMKAKNEELVNMKAEREAVAAAAAAKKASAAANNDPKAKRPRKWVLSWTVVLLLAAIILLLAIGEWTHVLPNPLVTLPASHATMPEAPPAAVTTTPTTTSGGNSGKVLTLPTPVMKPGAAKGWHRIVHYVQMTPSADTASLPPAYSVLDVSTCTVAGSVYVDVLGRCIMADP